MLVQNFTVVYLQAPSANNGLIYIDSYNRFIEEIWQKSDIVRWVEMVSEVPCDVPCGNQV